MTAWVLGMRLRVGIGAAFCFSLGLVALVQAHIRNAPLAARLRFGWTPEMLGWVLLTLGIALSISVVLQHIPLAAITSMMAAIVFAALTVALWPDDTHSYWFPIFTIHAAANQMASFLILARDWGRP